MSTIVFVIENEAAANENHTPQCRSKHFDCRIIFCALCFTFQPCFKPPIPKKTGKYAKEAWNTVATHAVCSELNAVLYFLSLLLMCLDLVLLRKGWQVPAEIKPFQRRDLIVQKLVIPGNEHSGIMLITCVDIKITRL